MYDHVLADVHGAVRRWRRRAEAESPPAAEAPAWVVGEADRAAALERAAAQAVRLVEASRRDIRSTAADRADARAAATGHSSADTARLLLATKNPHADRDACLGAILARCTALGLDVHTVQRTRAADARDLAAALYGTAWLHFERGPLTKSAWQALESRFSGPRFKEIFGTDFSHDLVVSASELLNRTDIPEQRLLEIWNEGRAPLPRMVLEQRYGAAVARSLCGAEPALDWFHGQWPIGIQQISSGLVVFALRHPELLDGAPLLIVNGHCLALADRFQTEDGRGCVLIEAGTPLGGPEVAEVRSWLVGQDNRPDRCAPGSIRRDAASGELPIADSSLAVSPWANVLHCSDGYFAGMVESARALGHPPRGLLRAELDRMGYGNEEVDGLLLSDPVVSANRTERRLSERTRGLSLRDCSDTIAFFYPPVFGPHHGYGAGLTSGRLLAAMHGLSAAAADTAAFSTVSERRRPVPARPPVPEVRHLTAAADETVGRAALAAGRLGLLVPAGGTGGRFGGYRLPETDPRRHKPLAPVFTVAARPVCALDIRAANARYWTGATGGDVPVGVMVSASTRAGVETWASGPGADGIRPALYEQPGVYRFRPDGLVGDPGLEPTLFLHDFLLRDPEGRPSNKPAGTLGLIGAFVIGDAFRAWHEAGVEYLAVANSDDVGFRIDPAVLGYLERSPGVEALVLVVPSVVQRGAAGVKGGYLGEVLTDGSWRTAVIDGAALAPGEEPYPYLNTNQIYLRTSALRRLFSGTDARTRADGVRRVREALPVFAERKNVVLDGGAREAIQLFQPVAELLRVLDGVTAAATTRTHRAGRRGAHVPLKTPGDVAVAQRFLDEAATGDELRFS